MKKKLKHKYINKYNEALKLARLNDMELKDMISIQRAYQEIFHINRATKYPYKHKYIFERTLAGDFSCFGKYRVAIIGKRTKKTYGYFYTDKE